MTDNEIIKALECLCGCALKCRECPYSPRYPFPSCQRQVAKDTLDLITRQQAEIEALIAGQETLQKYIAQQQAENEDKEETIQFADKVIKSLQADMDRLQANVAELIKQTKSEAYKEFADKVAHDINTYCEKNIRTKPSVDGVTGMKIAHNLIYKRLRETAGE